MKILIHHLSAHEQIADILTKPFLQLIGLAIYASDFLFYFIFIFCQYGNLKQFPNDLLQLIHLIPNSTLKRQKSNCIGTREKIYF